MRKKVEILSISLMLVLLNINLHSQEPNEIVKTGSADIHVGVFDIQSFSIDNYIPASGALITILNAEKKSVYYSGLTDKNGYLHLDGIEPGKYLIAVKNEEGDYFFQDGCLMIEAVEYSKAYLHLEQESDQESLRGEVEKMGIMSFLPKPVGKILEVSKSPFVSLKNKKDSETKELKKSDKLKIKKEKFSD